jgi:hypothetical protein
MKSWMKSRVNVDLAWRLRLSPSQTADVKSVTSACWMYTTTCTWLIQYILLKVFWVESDSHWCHLPAWSYGVAADGVRQPSRSMLSAKGLSLSSLMVLPCFIILVSGHHRQLRENPISLFKLVGCSWISAAPSLSSPFCLSCQFCGVLEIHPVCIIVFLGGGIDALWDAPPPPQHQLFGDCFNALHCGVASVA